MLNSLVTKYSAKPEIISFREYLDRCRAEPSSYNTAAERLLKAIGKPKIIDTQDDPILSRIFSNRKIKLYETFSDFYGLEDVIDNLVNVIKYNAQNLEESKSILYMLGPVGGGKSSLVEKLKLLMEQEPIYVVQDSPVFDNPLNVFWGSDLSRIEKEYKIPSYYIRTCPSPWLVQKLKDLKGDLGQLKVEKLYPSILDQVAISKIEPGDENNTDISTLVGKIDIRKLESYSQNHPYAYNYSGGLCRGNRGLVDFVEMFKAPLKMLNPLLTATQERNFNGTENIGSIPFEAIIAAHSNEEEWMQFKNKSTNKPFVDRISLVKVPYCLRSKEEARIYEKLISNSTLRAAPCAPWTLEMLSKFAVLSRLHDTSNSTLYSKLRVYDGENLKDTDPNAKPISEYKDEAGVTEGMTGVSTRFAFRVLSKTFNVDHEEAAANPIHLMYLLRTEIMKEQFPKDNEAKLLGFLDSVLHEKYLEFVEKQIRSALLAAHGDYCQTTFNKYVDWADAWLRETDYRDPDTQTMLDKAAINSSLEKVEKAGLNISNPREWRYEIVAFVLRYKAGHKGEMPKWDAYAKMRDVIERQVLDTTEAFLPIISFSPKSSDEDRKKHDDFVARMKDLGYTPRQARLIVEWFMRVRKYT
jgi:serine protein kinase